jgi:hypothetical protein
VLFPSALIVCEIVTPFINPKGESGMKEPRELTRAQLESIVGQIQSIFWLDPRTHAFDPDTSWNAETIEWVSSVLEDAGCKPETVIPAAERDSEHTRVLASPEEDVPLQCPGCNNLGDFFVRVSTLCVLIPAEEGSGRATFSLDDKIPADYSWIAFQCGTCGYEGPCEVFEGMDMTGRDESDGPLDPVREVLHGFIEDIEATGGCFRSEGGTFAPVADPNWTDLADTYLRACAALGRTPFIVES